jgi:hypothetical protein
MQVAPAECSKVPSLPDACRSIPACRIALDRHGRRNAAAVTPISTDMDGRLQVNGIDNVFGKLSLLWPWIAADLEICAQRRR